RYRITLPIRDARGHLCGFGARELGGGQPKYLNSPETEVFSKGKVLFLFDRALQPARQAGEIVVVEGYFDALAAHQAGYHNVVASLGTALTEDQLRLLQRSARRIVVALDPDPAGQNAIRQTIQRLHAVQRRMRPRREDAQRTESRTARISVVALPDGLDPDELLRRDLEEWRRVIAAAKPAFEFCLDAVLQVADETERLRQVTEEFIPLVASLDDPLERGHWVDVAAHRLSLPEASVLGAVERARRSASASNRAEAGAADTGGELLVPADQTRFRYILSMLWRHPRLLPRVTPLLSSLEPSDSRLRAFWQFTLTQRNQKTTEDLLALLPREHDLLTPAYAEALLRETSELAAADDPAVLAAIQHAAQLLRREMIQREMTKLQRLLEVTEDHVERTLLLEQLAQLTQERSRMDYNRGR
ncbi:MAG: toprim domain-containing protein, partial [Chloroflexi bacterium]|nr:toprim domain-containing protein [Chloroflexota bacterium]